VAELRGKDVEQMVGKRLAAAYGATRKQDEVAAVPVGAATGSERG
jgi:hypothetical protein